MDLRTKKTLRAITSAFLTLREKKPLEKISVKELTELAEISKATFYLHYRDIYDLSKHLQQEAVTDIFNDISHPEQLVTDPAGFIRELFTVYLAHQKVTDILFSGDQAYVFRQSIEAVVREQSIAQFPHLKDNPTFNVALSYAVHGCCFAYLENRDRFGISATMAVLSHITQVLRKEINITIDGSL